MGRTRGLRRRPRRFVPRRGASSSERFSGGRLAAALGVVIVIAGIGGAGFVFRDELAQGLQALLTPTPPPGPRPPSPTVDLQPATVDLPYRAELPAFEDPSGKGLQLSANSLPEGLTFKNLGDGRGEDRRRAEAIWNSVRAYSSDRPQRQDGEHGGEDRHRREARVLSRTRPMSLPAIIPRRRLLPHPAPPPGGDGVRLFGVLLSARPLTVSRTPSSRRSTPNRT